MTIPSEFNSIQALSQNLDPNHIKPEIGKFGGTRLIVTLGEGKIHQFALGDVVKKLDELVQSEKKLTYDNKVQIHDILSKIHDIQAKEDTELEKQGPLLRLLANLRRLLEDLGVYKKQKLSRIKTQTQPTVRGRVAEALEESSPSPELRRTQSEMKEQIKDIRARAQGLKAPEGTPQAIARKEAKKSEQETRESIQAFERFTTTPLYKNNKKALEASFGNATVTTKLLSRMNPEMVNSDFLRENLSTLARTFSNQKMQLDETKAEFNKIFVTNLAISTPREFEGYLKGLEKIQEKGSNLFSLQEKPKA